MLAYYFAKNGFYVLRYDATDHVGESDGDIFNTRLTSMSQDVMSAVDYLAAKFPHLPIGVVATSLSARASLRAASDDSRIRFLIGIAGVIDLQSTLKSVYKTDLVDGYIAGKIRGTADILGFNVGDSFLADATQNDFHSLSGTKSDLAKMTMPVTLFFGEHDPWVNARDVRTLLNETSSKNQEAVLIPNVFHNLYEAGQQLAKP